MTKRVGLAVATALAMALASGAALAADTGPILLPATPPPAPVTAAPDGFSFAGPYAGVYGGRILDAVWHSGIQAGFNFQRGALLVGVEAQAGVGFPPAGLEANLDLRAGLVIADRLLIYGEAGVGLLRTAGGDPFYSYGGGVEIGIGQRFSIFGEGRLLTEFGTGAWGVTVQAGINWHPNY
jgi:hypothetical protein